MITLSDLTVLGAELRRVAQAAPLDSLPELVGQLEQAKAIAWGRIVAPAEPLR